MKILAIFLFILSASLEYAEYTGILQLADYRIDRLKDYFKARDGFKKLSKIHFLWKIIFLFIAFSSPEDLLFILVLLFSIDSIYRLINFKKDKLFTLTGRSLLTFAVPFIVEFLFFVTFFENYWVFLFFALRLLIFATTSVILWPVSELLKKYYIKKATQKMKNFPNLRVIGVTGSYGKSSVKNTLAQILSVKFKTVFTPKNINTELGIAKFILKNDFTNYDVFIVEMGAYGRGEISVMAKMVKPEIGILTTIIEQHLALFKKIENIQLAKFELLEAVQKDGLAITNSDNKYCRERLDKIEAKTITFGREVQHKPDCLIKHTEQKEAELLIELVFNNKEWGVKTNLIGEHQAYNLAPCIIAADYLGMDKQEIIEKCKQLKAPERTLKLFKFGKSIVIDDSYNANPEGFKAALKVLGTFKGYKQKIVTARGMFELGTKTKEEHKKVGEEMSKYADEIILTTINPAKLFESGIDKTKTKIIYKINEDDLLKYLKEKATDKNLILIEHRLPEKVYDFLLKTMKEI